MMRKGGTAGMGYMGLNISGEEKKRRKNGT